MVNGVDFFGNANPMATDYGRAQHQAERDAASAKRKARDWQAYAQELKDALDKVKAERDEHQARAESWKATVRELDAKGILRKEVANNIYLRKFEEITSKGN